jgi:hypothetical protein
MPSDLTSSTENQLIPLSVSSTLARLAVIGVVILCVVAGFLYLRGWFNPQDLRTDQSLIRRVSEVPTHWIPYSQRPKSCS